MTLNNAPAPCQICASPVREIATPGRRLVDGSSAPDDIKRVCTNPQCPSKPGAADARLSQAV